MADAVVTGEVSDTVEGVLGSDDDGGYEDEWAAEEAGTLLVERDDDALLLADVEDRLEEEDAWLEEREGSVSDLLITLASLVTSVT